MNRVSAFLLAAITVLAGVIIFTTGCGSKDSISVSPQTTTQGQAEPAESQDAATADGRAIFTSAGCSACHTLAAAEANGPVGPRLDGLALRSETVVEIVRIGRGQMPSFADRLSNGEIEAVAQFVSAASR